MIQLSSAGKRFGPKLLFENLDWLITPQDRVGLVGAQRHRQIHAAEGAGRHRVARLRQHHLRQEHDLRLSAAGWPALSRPHRVRRVHVRLRRPARAGAGDGRAGAQDGRTRSAVERIRAGGRSLSAHLRRVSRARRLRARLAGRHRARRPRLPQGRLDAPHRRVLRRLADAHCARPSCCWRSRTCCCSTSPPTTSISKPATGWRSICCSIRSPTC